ncbi:MAG: glucosaminidase domain-containing protein [Hespellia sp.]|nr:glucosaminidase domain-containing protein [Hespellia sp.]
MNINRSYVSNNNTYASNNPQYIVVHNTDNFAAGADAKRHATAQYNGNFDNMSVHYYTDDTDTAYQAAPHNRGCWHVGVNYDGRLFGTANNKNTIGVEMCVQAGYNFDKAFANTVALVKQLMAETGIPADRVIQHYDVCAKNCPSQIRAKGMWNEFKRQIGTPSTAPATQNLYRARKTWADAKSQTGAYAVLQNAKNACEVGYTVFDWNGKAVYSNNGVQAGDSDESKFVEKVGKMATADMRKSGILASITTAQAILESGYGSTELAKNANNIFGMKTSLSGNTWSGSTWDGKSIYKKETKEQKEDGTAYTITADFRKYGSIEDSLGDHSAYLLGAKNGSKLRYEGLKGCLDYKRAAQLIKDGGYATDVSYVSKLCNIIERWNLEKFNTTEQTPENAEVWYRVRTSWADAKTQKGAFHNLDNAKQCAKENPGYSVFDEHGNAIYSAFQPYMVRVTITDLNIRKGPGTNYGKTGNYTGIGAFTIVEEANGEGATRWGKLKSGAGWISLDYANRI